MTDVATKPAAPVEPTPLELEPFRDGFSRRAVIGALFIAAVMVPAAIYMSLLLGGGAAGSLTAAADWVTVILFLELARRSFQKLSRQEINVLLYVAGHMGTAAGAGGLAGGVFSALIWNSYMKTSSATEPFGLHAPGVLPDWVAPNAAVIGERNLWDLANWWPAITVLLLSYVLGKVQGFVTGYLAFRVTVDMERLAFPLAPIGAQGSMALAEHSGRTESWRWNTFSVGAAIGGMFSLLAIAVPSITGTFLAAPIKVLPNPYLDLTPAIQTFMPATALVLTIDLGAILVGMIIPWRVLIGGVVGTIIFQLILNPFVFYPLDLLPQAKQTGLNAAKIAQVNSLDFYMSSGLGASFAIAAAGIFSFIWALSRKAAKKKEKASDVSTAAPRYEIPKDRGDFPIWLMVTIFLTVAVAYVFFCHILVPDFPLWIFFAFAFLYTPLVSYITARMQGITGIGVAFPMVREGSFFLSGYERPDVWFAPLPMHDYGGGASFFRQLELTRTKFTSILKAELLVLPIMIIASFLFWSYIWKLDPIPSEKYPPTQIFWPVNAQTSALWSTASSSGVTHIFNAIKLPIIVLFAGLTMVTLGGCSLLGISAEYVYGFIGGSSTGMVHILFPTLLGALLSRHWLSKKFGQKEWRSYVPVLLAGYACGAGLVGMLSMAIVFLQRSVSSLPY